MPENDAHKAATRLTLRSQLADLALVWPWVDSLAVEHAIPADTHYAINLCLEEALSNIIRHGYAGQPNHAITIDFTPTEENWLTFAVEDSAPHFTPAEPEDCEAAVRAASIEDVKPGGQGVPLMRRFAGTLRWEQLPKGNRLTMGFMVAASAPQAI